MTDDEIQSRIDKAVAELMECCSAVQILTSYVDNKSLTHFNLGGSGDWYARQGMAQAFVNRGQARNYLDVKRSEYADQEPK
jgi:hypothetical protein